MDNARHIRHGITSLEKHVYTSKRHPQVGHIKHEGKRVPVYIGFYGDAPCWYTVDRYNDPQYLHCAEKTMPISEDPEVIGEQHGNTQIDYTLFLNMFAGNILTLTNDMTVTPEQRTVIETISDTCLAHQSSEIAVPGKRIMISNLDEVLAYRTPMVRLISDDGTLILPAYRFVIIPAKEAI